MFTNCRLQQFKSNTYLWWGFEIFLLCLVGREDFYIPPVRLDFRFDLNILDISKFVS